MMGRFLKLLRGCSVEDLKPLLSCSLRDDRVLRYMPEEKAVFLSCSSVVPWPILWLAARYGPKHILDMNKKQAMKHVDEALSSFKTKILWRWFFASRAVQLNPLQHLKIKRPAVKFSGLHPPELDAWCGGIASSIRKVVLSARLKDTLETNTPRLACYALKLLATSDWKILKNDKEGGWSVCSKDQLVSIHEKLLSSACYMPISWSVEKERDIASWHSKVAKDLVQFEVDRLDGIEVMKEEEVLECRSAMMRTVKKSMRNGKVRGKVLPLVKSHKEEGEVSVRAVHSCPAFEYEGLSRWLIHEIRQKTKDLPHLIKHSGQVVKSLEKFKEKDYFFVKIDIKDFYVVGDREWLVSNLADAFEGGLREQVYRVARFLVFNQYVASQTLDESFEVITGFGIGMIHSGDCADLLYHHLVERHIVCCLDVYGIAKYFRFRDDTLVLARAGTRRGLGARALVSQMRVFAQQFELKTEDVSTVSVRYLDLNLVKDESGAIVCSPVYKDPGLARRLGPDSFHHPNVHRSWPRMLVDRAMKLSSSCEIFQEYWNLLRAELEPLGISLPRVVKKTVKSESRRVFRLVLPFHSTTARQIQRVVSAFNKDATWKAILACGCREFENFDIACAWRNVHAPIVNLLR